jgi:hypothetical protein
MATILQITGAAILCLGVGLLSIPAGLIIAGAFTILFGVAIDRIK